MFPELFRLQYLLPLAHKHYLCTVGTPCTHHPFICQKLLHKNSLQYCVSFMKHAAMSKKKAICQPYSWKMSFHNITGGSIRACPPRSIRPWLAPREAQAYRLTHAPQLATCQHNPYDTHVYKEDFLWGPLPHTPPGKYSTWNTAWKKAKF
jgi:hypothetical protein